MNECVIIKIELFSALTDAGRPMEEAQAQAANLSLGILQSSVVMIFFFTLSKKKESPFIFF
jgi:hypothetical protein